MKVQFFFDDESTVVDASLFNGLRFCAWKSENHPEEGVDGLTGKAAKVVYKVYFMDGTSPDGYVKADMLAAIANGAYEVVEE